MKSLRVRDIMTTDVTMLPASASVETAARVMVENRISGAPVFDQDRVLGVITKSDLADPRNWTKEGSSLTVRSVMTPLVYAVRPGDPVMTAVRLMVLENIHRALVVSEEGKVVGIVTPMDVMRAMARGELVQEGDYARDDRTGQHAEAASAVQFVDLRAFELSGY
jgi:CBS domain-containing protein